MNSSIDYVDLDTARGLIYSQCGGMLTIDDQHTITDCMFLSTKLWAGVIDGTLICAWGLIPPTLLSDRAYLWMYHTPALEEHKFIFVRKSQIAMKEMLKSFPRIMGHVLATNESGKRWLKWLGARFLDHEGPLVRFEIVRPKHG